MRNTSRNRHMEFLATATARPVAVTIIGVLLIFTFASLSSFADQKDPENENQSSTTRDLHKAAQDIRLANPQEEKNSPLVIDNAKLKEIGADAHLSEGGSLGSDATLQTTVSHSYTSARRIPGSRGGDSSRKIDLSSVSANLSRKEIQRAIEVSRQVEAKKRIQALDSSPLEKKELQQQIRHLQKKRAALTEILLENGTQPHKK